MVWEAVDVANDIQAWLPVARALERHVRSSATKSKTKVGYRKTEAWQSWKVAWYLLHWSSGCWSSRSLKKKCAKKVGSSDASSNALQDQRCERETCRTPDARKTKYACIVEADESTRTRLEGTLQKDHEDHIAGKRINSLKHYDLVHKLNPMPKSNENTRCESSSGQRMGKTRANTGMPADGSQKQKRGDRWSKERRQNLPFRVINGHLSSQEFGVGTQASKKYKGRVVLRGNIVKDDSGSRAVFTKQSSSESQMTVAIVMDVKAKLPGCAGQAADAVSAYTQVKMADVPSLLKIPKSECPDIWIRLPKHKWPKSRSSMEHQVVPLERNLYGHRLAGLLWERQLEKFLLENSWEKNPTWEC